jgi:hypothetical protein
MVSRGELEMLRATYPDLPWRAGDGASEPAAESRPLTDEEQQRER